MSRPRTTNTHLPKFVQIKHGAYWWCPTGQKPARICALTDDHELWTYLAKVTDPKPIQSMNDLFDRYTLEIVPKLAPRTQKDYHRHLKRLRGVFGAMRPDDIKARDVGQYLTVGAPVQRNREIAVLSAVFSKAVGKWYVADRNPCEKVERNQTKSRDRYVTDDEFKLFRAMVPARVQIAMDLALLTGQRQGDLLGLRWTEVDVDGMGVLFRQAKTGKRLEIEITPTLEEVLVRAKRLSPDLPRVYVLRKRNGSPYTGEGFRAIWQRYQRAWGKEHERFTFHDIRAKSASDSTGLQAAYERLGHTSQSMTRKVYDRGVRRVKPLK